MSAQTDATDTVAGRAADDEPTPYRQIGGESAVRSLVDAFYDLMDEDPDYFAIRKLHPPSLTGSREKLFLFLCGWLGGPPRYVETYGHPRLRMRHLPFAIGTRERDQWLDCMHRAMAAAGIPETLREPLAATFSNTADWMRNVEG